jgi:hypothetical protein
MVEAFFAGLLIGVAVGGVGIPFLLFSVVMRHFLK